MLYILWNNIYKCQKLLIFIQWYDKIIATIENYTNLISEILH